MNRPSKHFEFVTRCRAFGRMAEHKLYIPYDCGGEVLAWDDVAECFTRHHGISQPNQRRLARKALDHAEWLHAQDLDMILVDGEASP